MTTGAPVSFSLGLGPEKKKNRKFFTGCKPVSLLLTASDQADASELLVNYRSNTATVSQLLVDYKQHYCGLSAFS